MAVNIGPKIGIDGEAQFRKEINGLIQQQKTLASEMRAVTSAFDQNNKGEKSLTTQTKILNQQIQVQQQRIEKLKEGLSAASKEFGEADSRTLKWKQAINNATTDLNKMKSQLSSLEKGVDDVGDSMEDAAKEAVSFGDVLKANVLSGFIVQGIKEVASQIKEMAVDFVEAAASVKAETSQFAQTFGEFGQQAKDAISTVANNAGILDTRLKTVGTQIFAFARASGGNATESLELMEKALQATADGAAYYDRSLEGTAESLQSFLKGNYENDAVLGLSATETTRNAAAMEQFGKKFNDLTEIQKQQTLLQMVIDAQELSGAMGQAAREAGGWENVQGNLNESWRQFMAAAGEPFLENLVPIVQEVTKQIVSLTNGVDWEAFGEKVTGVVQWVIDNGSYIVSTITGIGAAFVTWNVASIIEIVVSKINTFSTAIKNGETVMKALNFTLKANPWIVIATVIAGVVAALVTLWNTNEGFRNWVIEAWKNISEAFKSAVTVIVEFFTETIPSALNDLKNAIISAFSAAWEAVKSVWDSVKPYFDAVWNGIKFTFSVVKQVLTGYFQAAWNGIMLVWNAVTGYFQNIWNTIKGIFSAVKSVLSGDFQGAWEAIKNVFAGWSDFFGGLWNSLKNTFSGVFNFFVDIGKNVIQGIKDGIATAWNGLVGWFNSLWDGLFGGRTANVTVNTQETRTVKTVEEPQPQKRKPRTYMPAALSAAAEMLSIDTSPLHTYQSMDPTFYQRVGTELQQGYYRVQTAMGNVADYTNERKAAKASGTTSTRVDIGGIRITVNPSPGMDEAALAEKVSVVLQNMLRQTQEVWA